LNFKIGSVNSDHTYRFREAEYYCMSAQAANRPQTGGCLKCGEKGHWARDCTAPREKWLPRDYQSQQNNANQAATQDGANGDLTAEGQEK